MPGLTTYLRKVCFLAIPAAIFLVLAVSFVRRQVHAQTEKQPAAEETSISIQADYSFDWEAKDEHVSLLRGRCRIVQGETTLLAEKMVVWHRTKRTGLGTRDQLTIYLEEGVHLERPGETLTDSAMVINLLTREGVTFEVPHRRDGEPAPQDALYQRASRRRQTSARQALLQTQFAVPSEESIGSEISVFQVQPPTSDLRRVRLFPRSLVLPNILSFESTERTPAERLTVVTGGVNLVIDGIPEYGTVSLIADRMVIWTRAGMIQELQAGRETVQTRDEPMTVYLEGNIEIRQGSNHLRASHAVYDAREDRALLLNAELRAFIEQLDGNVRVRAERLRQLSQNSFHAQNAWTTTSQFGKPGYRLQSSDIFIESRYDNALLGPGMVDPVTGAPLVQEPTPWIRSLNNTFLIEDVPLLYSPYLSAPAEDPNIPLRRATFEQDRIFGTQLRTVWDMFQIIGREEPPGTRWDLLADYYSDRGPAVGTSGEYSGFDLFGVPGPYHGEGLAFYVRDDGKDNLGLDRRRLIPKSNNRYRFQLRHRQEVPENITLFGELGLLSDRNFLEQYYEQEFDTGKDVESLLYAKQQVDNWAGSVLIRPQLNNFSTTTEWLPRGDMYALAEPLLGGWLTWSMHSSAGYGRLRVGDLPTDPADVYTPLLYDVDVVPPRPYVDSDGAVLMSRHELDAPFSLGPVRVVPYLLGEGAFWSNDFTGNELDRLVGSAGVRSSLMFWRAFPGVYSRIFNLNGLAHKVLWEAEYAATQSSEDLIGVPQYNEFDDNAQERFRNRFFTNTFGSMLPQVFEPRFYAVRTGSGRAVTAPYHELIDDQQVARLALRQRLQTKVGPPERLRIKDWMIFDVDLSYFPDSARDNFGEDIGLLGGRYRWNVGDRTSLLASSYYDFFDNAQQLWNLAVLSQRSRRGSIYLGIRQIRGAGLDSQIVSASYTYRMSPKWISTAGTAYDVAESRNAGQSWTVTRVGADFLFHFGANFDESKNNAGIAFAIEPRFGAFGNSTTQLSSLLGTTRR